MMAITDMPVRVWLRVCGGGTRFPGHQGYVTVTGDSIEHDRRTMYVRADLVEQMAEALRFYSGVHEPGLSNPNAGPWGVNSTDFGERARAALQAYEAAQ